MKSGGRLGFFLLVRHVISATQEQNRQAAASNLFRAANLRFLIFQSLKDS
jgi:hypothetical protein